MRRGEGIRNLNACYRTPELRHPFPRHQPIHYGSQPDRGLIKIESGIAMSSSIEGLIYVRMCAARWIEGHLGGPAALLLLLHYSLSLSLSHTQSLLGCWAELKPSHGHIKTIISAQERWKGVRWGFFCPKVTAARGENSQTSSLRTKMANRATRCCVCYGEDVLATWLSRLALVACIFGYLGI